MLRNTVLNLNSCQYHACFAVQFLYKKGNPFSCSAPPPPTSVEQLGQLHAPPPPSWRLLWPGVHCHHGYSLMIVILIVNHMIKNYVLAYNIHAAKNYSFVNWQIHSLRKFLLWYVTVLWWPRTATGNFPEIFFYFHSKLFLCFYFLIFIFVFIF